MVRRRWPIDFAWFLIEADPDDNKFVDCAIAGQADYIVTHDKHFRILDEIQFPRVRATGLEALREMLSVG